MSLYIPTVDEQIADYQRCIEHFIRVKSRYYSRLKKPQDNGVRSAIKGSMEYFDNRLIHYRKKIRELEKWRD